MRRASSRPIARPRPNPPAEPAEAPRWKRSKMRSRSSAGIPGPTSATVITAVSRPGVRLDPHRRPARPVAQGVVEQDADHARDRVRVAVAPRGGFRQHDLDRRRALAGAQLELGGDGAHDLAELDGLRAQRDRGVEARQVEQLGRERREAVELAARGVDLAQRVELVDLAVADVLLQQLHRPLSIVSGVRSSCEAVETKARRAASWRRSSSCMRASARARSPTSSRRSSCGIAASGPSSLIRSAAARRRASRRSRVEESAMASRPAITQADDGGDEEAGAHLPDQRRDLVELALGEQHGRQAVLRVQRARRRRPCRRRAP